MNPVVLIPTYIFRPPRPTSGRSRRHTTTPPRFPAKASCRAASIRCARCAVSARSSSSWRRSLPSRTEQQQESRRREYFSDLDITVIAAPELALIRQRMGQLSMRCAEIGLEGYGAVRDLGLLVGEHARFRRRGVSRRRFRDRRRGVPRKGDVRSGKAAPAAAFPSLRRPATTSNSEGSYRSSRSAKWYDRFWEQGKAFNEWIERAMRGPRLSRSNHVCGGCLALHRRGVQARVVQPRGSRAAKTSTICSICVCTEATSGSTIDG